MLRTKQEIATDIRSRADRLQHLFRTYARLCASDDPTLEEVRRYHFTRYLCVLTSGFLEVSVHLIYGYYIDTRLKPVMPQTQFRRLLAQTSRIYNINEQNSLLLTRAINAPWEQSLISAIQGSIQTSINDLVEQRNIIAHGKDSISLTHPSLLEYLRDAVTLANILHSYL